MKVPAEKSMTVGEVEADPAVCPLQGTEVVGEVMVEENIVEQDLLKDTEMNIEMIGIGEDLLQGEEEMIALEVHHGAIQEMTSGDPQGMTSEVLQ